MNNSIIVDPSKLDDTAARVEASEADYERLYRSLYGEVDKLAGNWGGKDNAAFNDRIMSYEDDFKQISIIMKQYADFLKASARAYRETQDELTSAANKLRV